ncbi:MAG TPA: hypothetical protein VIM79_25735 [Niastella sp.]
MKKAMRNYGISTIVLFALTIVFSTVTLANDEAGKPSHATELKFIGNLENQPVFELNLTNTEEDEFTVTFRDENGNILYTDKFKGANLTKKFLLKTDDLTDAVLNVVVKSKKGNTSDVYIINRSHSYVEQTVVNKIK